jgi:flagellar assembly protein FliH
MTSSDDQPPWGDSVLAWLPDEVLGRRRRVRQFEPTIARAPELKQDKAHTFEPMSLQSIAALRDGRRGADALAREALKTSAVDASGNIVSLMVAPDAQALDVDATGAEGGGDAIAHGASDEPAAPFIPDGFVPQADHDAAVNAARDEAFARGRTEGVEAGRAAAEAAMRDEVEVERAALQAMAEALRTAGTDLRGLYRPFEQLSLHLAEQLVRGELDRSGLPIARLVNAALDTVDSYGGAGVVLTLHPADAAQFRQWVASPQGGPVPELQVREDATLTRGSLRLAVGETVVEDLLEGRLAALARTLEAPGEVQVTEADRAGVVADLGVGDTPEAGPDADPEADSDADPDIGPDANLP